MKIKSSNKISYYLLLTLTLLVVVLVIFSGDKFGISEKSNKKHTQEISNTKQNTTLNFIEITLSKKNYNKLKKYRNRALSAGVISAKDKKYVSATIIFNGKEYKANIRLKGDWTDHLVGDKWSFRIKLKGNKTILGMRKFSIHHPKTRGYINEWLFHKASKAEGLIGLRYGFVEGALHIKKEDGSGYVNNNLGIYAMEETFDKRMLENNKRKESVVLKFSEENWWNDVKKRIEVGSQSGLRWDKFWSNKSGSWKFPVTVFSESKVLEDTLMRNYFKLSKNLISNFRKNKYALSDIFNVKQLAMHNALANLFGAQHGGHIINLRFYYNPITSKLEPISFDGNSGQKITNYHPFIYAKTKRDTLYFLELIKALEAVSEKKYLDKILSENKKETAHFNEILKREFDGNNININRDVLRHNQDVIKEELEALKGLFTSSEEFTNRYMGLLKENDVTQWKFINAALTPTNKKYREDDVFSFARKDTSRISYTLTKFIKNDFKEEYIASFIVKPSTKGDFFAIRIQGEYPNRVDAIFDLTDGKVTGVQRTGDFQKGNASIKKLQKGWYLCTLKTIPKSNIFKIFIGPANGNVGVSNWESKSNINNQIYIAL